MSLADGGETAPTAFVAWAWTLWTGKSPRSLSAAEAHVGAWSTKEGDTEQGEPCGKASWDPLATPVKVVGGHITQFQRARPDHNLGRFVPSGHL